MPSSSTSNNNVAQSPTLTLVETTALLTVDREDAIKTKHPMASTWFNLVSRGGRVSAECWNYFHVIESIIDESKLDNKWKEKLHLACCNLCGKVFSYSTIPKNNASAKPKMTNATMESHLMSHNISFGKLYIIVFVSICFVCLF